MASIHMTSLLWAVPHLHCIIAMMSRVLLLLSFSNEPQECK